MATLLKNLSSYDPSTVPDGSHMKIGIVTSEWNIEITRALLEGACNTLIKHGVKSKNILIEFVPGSIELTFASRIMAESKEVDAIICLGCVVQGQTRHFDYVCQSVTDGITELNLTYDIPFIFGVLTTNNLEQARERAGGKHGNKGDEAAVTALRMIQVNRKMKS
jgi:6,7-dimethyl-8-ribityllumazine synthase